MADEGMRTWEVPEHPETGTLDLDVFGHTLEEVAALLHRVGGAVRLISKREQIRPEVYVTVGVTVQWTLHAPTPPRSVRRRHQAEGPRAGTPDEKDIEAATELAAEIPDVELEPAAAE